MNVDGTNCGTIANETGLKLVKSSQLVAMLPNLQFMANPAIACRVSILAVMVIVTARVSFVRPNGIGIATLLLNITTSKGGMRGLW